MESRKSTGLPVVKSVVVIRIAPFLTEGVPKPLRGWTASLLRRRTVPTLPLSLAVATRPLEGSVPILQEGRVLEEVPTDWRIECRWGG